MQGDLSFLGKIKLFGNSLKLLDLSGNDLSTNIEDLLTIINTCNNLEILHLGSCSLSDNDLKILVPSLKTHPNLRQIYFNNNLKLTDLAFADLKELMQTNKKLKYLGLAGIEFTDQTLADLKVLAFACKLQISSNLAEQRRSEQQPLTNYLPRCLIS